MTLECFHHSSDLYYSMEDAKRSLTSKLHRFDLWDSKYSSVLDFLSNAIPEINSESWTERISIGGLYFNGLRIEKDRPLSFPCKIEYYELSFPISDIQSKYPKISEKNIIYRGQGLIAALKPAGLSCLPAKDQKLYNLRDMLLELLGTNSDLHMPSRLDTSVSGLIILSEDRRLHNKLQLLYANQKINKEYLSLVSPAVDWDQIEINQPIARSKLWGVLREVNTISGKPSLTYAQKVRTDSTSNRSLLRVFPKTGRTHQIRLHLAYSGCPIVGDRFYKGVKHPELHLMSNSVRFNHPIDKNDIYLELPDDLKSDWAR